ncbi:MAG: fimbrial protein [Aeromonadaceae bacterium]
MNIMSGIWLCAVLTLGAYALPAQAECQSGPSQWVAQVGMPIGYAPGAAEWSALTADMQIQQTSQPLIDCSHANPSPTALQMLYQPNAAPVGSVIGPDGAPRSVFASQAPGIGFAVGFREPLFCGAEGIRFVGNRAHQGSDGSLSICSSSENAAITTAANVSAQIYLVFYRIPGGDAQISLPNTSQQSIGQLWFLGARGEALLYSPVTVDISAFTLGVPSCLAGVADLRINMGKLSVGDFHGVGSQAGSEQRFALNISCSRETPIRIAFFGQTADANNQILALTHTPQAAGGIGIHLWYGDDTLAAGQSVTLNSSQVPVLANGHAGQTQQVHFAARYEQIASQVTPGQAEAMATVQLIYN